jgi:predicted permease
MDVFADAWRLLRARPAGNLAAVSVLALGLTAVMSVAAIARLVMNDAPAALPAQALYAVGTGFGPGQGLTLTGADALALRSEIPGLADASLTRWNDFNIGSARTGDGSHAERVSGLLVDGDPFRLLGWSMALGRGFDAGDFRPGAPAAVVIGDALWRTRFAADPAIIGRQVRVDGAPATVIGVLPPRRAYPFQQQMYLAIALQTARAQMDRPWAALARIDDADALGGIEAALAAQQADRERRLGEDARQAPLRLAALFDGQTDPGTYLLIVVLAIVVGLVMLLAASNVGGLLLVQWLGRGRDLATRHALGATSGRVVAGLFVQALMLVDAAWLLAVASANLVLAGFGDYLRSVENGMPLYAELSLSLPVLAISALVAVAMAAVLMLPTWRRLRRGDLAVGLRSGARTAGGLSRFGRALFGVQSLLAVVTVLATVQAMLGARDQMRAPLGMETGSVVVAQFHGSNAEAKARFAEQLRERLAIEPGVEAVTVSANIPVALVTRRDVVREEQRLNVDFAPVDAGYRSVYGFAMRSGRWFDSEDVAAARPVAVLDPAAAEALFGDNDPIGRSFSIQESAGNVDYQVIGVSQPVRLVGRGGADGPSVFAPVPRAPVYELAVSVRVRGAPEAFAPRLRQIATGIDADFGLTDVGSFAAARWRASGWTRMVLGLFAPLGVLALVLAAAGLSALLGSLVAQRVREIGVRRALGAPAGGLIRTLLGGLGLWGGVGSAFGVGLAFLMVGPLSQTLYGDNHVGLVSVLGTLAAMAVVLLVASAGPVRRALRIQPTEALREE